MATSFKEFQYELHTHYKKFLDQPMAHRKANKPKEIRHQKRANVAVDNRSRQEFTHFSGSRSFIQFQAMEVLGNTSCYNRGLGGDPKIPRATSRADTTQRENVELRQVVHNLQSKNERILALLEESMPGATARIGSPRVPTTPHSSSSPSSPDHKSHDDH
ncbi:Hypothetical predicted protein [Olea europaea subsp. europaea]|uniref:CACTA en-spm transposon protein n=1 Tax=Olea europaea subsp. europaea TaxID=158383 RepID=A0A8S0UZ74_OLEEU|nr:Hypothetical predicted protein [Olea europaea subsp. europaea]